jgi:enoyl-CoA hydratase/carnithine racemase
VTGSDTVRVERRRRIQIITLARDHKCNAIDASITAGLDAALNERPIRTLRMASG